MDQSRLRLFSACVEYHYYLPEPDEVAACYHICMDSVVPFV